MACENCRAIEASVFDRPTFSGRATYALQHSIRYPSIGVNDRSLSEAAPDEAGFDAECALGRVIVVKNSRLREQQV
jgi:hypothetical protein